MSEEQDWDKIHEENCKKWLKNFDQCPYCGRLAAPGPREWSPRGEEGIVE